MKGGKEVKEIPEWKNGEPGSVPITERKGLEELWRHHNERKSWVPVSEEGKRWRRKVEREVRGWELVRE